MLHQAVGWTPGSSQIRPTAAVMSRKKTDWETVDMEYEAMNDYVYGLVFGVPLNKTADGRLQADEAHIAALTARVFRANDYAYDVAENTFHWVMWYPATGGKDVADEVVSADIKADLQTHLNHPDFEFVWYPNPKMTVPGICHFQVFWRSTAQIQAQSKSRTSESAGPANEQTESAADTAVGPMATTTEQAPTQASQPSTGEEAATQQQEAPQPLSQASTDQTQEATQATQQQTQALGPPSQATPKQQPPAATPATNQQAAVQVEARPEPTSQASEETKNNQQKSRETKPSCCVCM